MTLTQDEIDRQIAEVFQREKEGEFDTQQVLERIKLLTNVSVLRQMRRPYFWIWIKYDLLLGALFFWWLSQDGFKWDVITSLFILVWLLPGLFSICKLEYQIKQAEKDMMNGK